MSAKYIINTDELEFFIDGEWDASKQDGEHYTFKGELLNNNQLTFRFQQTVYLDQIMFNILQPELYWGEKIKIYINSDLIGEWAINSTIYIWKFTNVTEVTRNDYIYFEVTSGVIVPVKINIGYGYNYLYSIVNVHFIDSITNNYLFPIKSYNLRIGNKYKFISKRIKDKFFEPFIQELFISNEMATQVQDIYFYY